MLLAGHLVVGGVREVEQHQHRDIAHLAHAAHHDARVGLLAHAHVDHRSQRGVEVDLVAVFELAQALHALRLHGVENELHAPDQAAVFGEDGVDHAPDRPTLARRSCTVTQAGTLELDQVVPLGVVAGRHQRLAAFALVERHAQVFVGKELGAHAPRFPARHRPRSPPRSRWPTPSRSPDLRTCCSGW